jgi:hypothetical protein
VTELRATPCKLFQQVYSYTRLIAAYSRVSFICWLVGSLCSFIVRGAMRDAQVLPKPDIKGFAAMLSNSEIPVLAFFGHSRMSHFFIRGGSGAVCGFVGAFLFKRAAGDCMVRVLLRVHWHVSGIYEAPRRARLERAGSTGDFRGAFFLVRFPAGSPKINPRQYTALLISPV